MFWWRRISNSAGTMKTRGNVCGKTLTQKKGTGKSNLVSHIKSQHPDFEKKFAKSTVTNFYQSGASASRTATNIYGWMDLICMKLLPFSTVEDR